MDPNIAYSIAIDHHAYEYLATLDLSKILVLPIIIIHFQSILRTDSQFAEYVLRQDAIHNKARLFSVCDEVPDLANSIIQVLIGMHAHIQEYPQYYWLIQLHKTPEACEAILNTIKRIQERSVQSTALSCLWFHCENVKREVERLQEAVACEETLMELGEGLTKCTLSDLTTVTLNGIEEWNDTSKERLTSLLTRINIGREQGEDLTDIELAVLHHALCVDEGRNESYEQSMLQG